MDKVALFIQTLRFATLMSDTLTLKFIVCGASDTGKTALVKRFTENTFDKDLPYTVGVDFNAVTTEAEGRDVKLQIWDLAGNKSVLFWG